MDDSWDVEAVVQYRMYYRKEQWLIRRGPQHLGAQGALQAALQICIFGALLVSVSKSSAVFCRHGIESGAEHSTCDLENNNTESNLDHRGHSLESCAFHVRGLSRAITGGRLR